MNGLDQFKLRIAVKTEKESEKMTKRGWKESSMQFKAKIIDLASAEKMEAPSGSFVDRFRPGQTAATAESPPWVEPSV